MSQPTVYVPGYDFSAFQGLNPTTPLPGDRVDTELGSVSESIGEICDNLALLQRDDGELANGTVGVEQLDAAVVALIAATGGTVRGAWVTATNYVAKDVVTQGGVTYICVTAHTSGTFATDLTAVKWIALSQSFSAFMTTFLAASSAAGAVSSLGVREQLTAARTYYVRTDGSDANTGLVNSAVGAFLTIQAAVNAVYALDTRGYAVTIQVADGTYTAGASVVGPMPGVSLASGTPLTIQGNNGAPGNVIISTTSANCFAVTDGARAYITGFELRTTTSGDCLIAARGAEIRYGTIRFGVCAAFHKECNDHARMYNNGNYSVVGNAVAHEHCNNRSYILNLSATVTISGTPAFSSFYCGASSATIQYVGVTFSGSATGKRFLIHQAGAFISAGASLTYLPGDVAGQLLSSSSYGDDTASYPIADGGILTGSQVIDFASVADNASSAATSVTVTGAAVGDFVQSISADGDIATTDGVWLFGRVSAASTVKVQLHNDSGGVFDATSQTVRVVVIKRSAVGL